MQRLERLHVVVRRGDDGGREAAAHGRVEVHAQLSERAQHLRPPEVAPPPRGSTKRLKTATATLLRFFKKEVFKRGTSSAAVEKLAQRKSGGYARTNRVPPNLNLP